MIPRLFVLTGVLPARIPIDVDGVVLFSANNDEVITFFVVVGYI